MGVLGVRPPIAQCVTTGHSDLHDPDWIPVRDSLDGPLAQIRRFSSFRAYGDTGTADEAELTPDTRLVGRSVWNTRWILIIPGATFLNDPGQGLDFFRDDVSDILLFFQTYGYSGN